MLCTYQIFEWRILRYEESMFFKLEKSSKGMKIEVLLYSLVSLNPNPPELNPDKKIVSKKVIKSLIESHQYCFF